MAGLWCLRRYWRQTGNCYRPHKNVVYVHFFPDPGLTPRDLYGSCFLDEYEAIYPGGKKESDQIPVGVPIQKLKVKSQKGPPVVKQPWNYLRWS